MKYALVTGSTKGIGRQIGIDLLRKGCFVFFNYGHSDSAAEKLEKEIASISKNYKIIKSNLSSADSLNSFCSSIKSAAKKLDYLVLNTAITDKTPFENISFDKWNEIITTNLSMPFFIVQKLSSLLQKDGRIIFIGALLGIVPHAISVSYGISKAGLHMLAKYLVKYFAPNNITVNVIAPGFVDTPWQANKSKEHRTRIENKISLKRFALPEEISKTCLHIIDNGYINGQIIVLDGGYDYGET